MALKLFSSRSVRFLVIGLIAAAFARVSAFADYSPFQPATVVGSFDNYVLAISDENDFCAVNPSKKECKAGAPLGLALHGLWPDRNNDPSHTYQYCGTVTKAELESDWCASKYDIRGQLSDPTFVALESVMPGTQSCLYNHEWYAHGTCSGLVSEQYFEDAQELAAKFIALPHFHDLIASQAGKAVSKAQLMAALVADLGAGAENSILFLCRKNNHGAEKAALTEVDLTLDAQSFMKFPARESFGTTASKGAGSCPADGILITSGK